MRPVPFPHHAKRLERETTTGTPITRRPATHLTANLTPDPPLALLATPRETTVPRKHRRAHCDRSHRAASRDLRVDKPIVAG